MRFAGGQTVYSCREHEAVSIPITRLLDDVGRLTVYPEVQERGYFDVDYRRGELVLKATRYVGLIPISDAVAIHVEPKIPISNLLYMISRSGLRLLGLDAFIRGYRYDQRSIENIEEVYVHAFLSALRRVAQRGIYKKYVARMSNRGLAGRTLFSETVSKYFGKGIRHRRASEVYTLTPDNRENQIIKYAAQRLHQHFRRHPGGSNLTVALDLEARLRVFANVDCSEIGLTLIARETLPLIRSLPNQYRFYEPVLWLSYLLAVRSGISLEAIGSAKFETVIVDVSDVFEKYVRKLCEEGGNSAFSHVSVCDGNIRPVQLFTANTTYLTQPDVYFVRKGGAVAVADVKYKTDPSTDDRYELLAFCEALGVNRAAFICPVKSPKMNRLEHQGTTRGARSIHIVRIDLGASDMQAEERSFQQNLGYVLGL